MTDFSTEELKQLRKELEETPWIKDPYRNISNPAFFLCDLVTYTIDIPFKKIPMYLNYSRRGIRQDADKIILRFRLRIGK